jgi:DNA replication protein DnaC
LSSSGSFNCRQPGDLIVAEHLFYQVIATRHSHRRSTVITTNTPFSEWGNVLYNTTIANAIVDRLVENSEIFLLGGESLRKPKNPPPSPAE